LASCSDPKKTEIPSDPNKWETISDQVKQLDQEDKRLLAAYLARMGIASAFTHKAVVVPPGTTIADAISQERDFEAKMKSDDAAAAAVKQQAQAAAAVEINKMNQAATFAALGVTILPKNYDVGRYSPQVSVPFAIRNNTDKEISGIKGTIELQDIFGSTLRRLSIAADRSIPAKSQVTMGDYVWDMNQFDNDDQHLMSVDLTKVRAKFTPSMIVFADGTKIVAPDSD
jgi:hypothetical protein